MTATVDVSTLDAFIANEVGERLKKGECTKRTAVRLAVVEAVAQGLVQPGCLLPSEKALVDITGTSLGTVQAALSELAHTGVLVRRRGDGTRVRAGRNRAEAMWHFRFLDRESGKRLGMVRSDVTLSHDFELGPHSRFLGEDSQGYIRIDRSVVLSNSKPARAVMTLLYNKAAPLLAVPAIELSSLSIRPYLDRHLGLVTRRASHEIAVIKAEEAQASGLPSGPGSTVYEIHARAYAPNDDPVYFQRIFCYTEDFRLEF